MGITINDTITLDNGLSTTTGYGSFYKSNIHIVKETVDGPASPDEAHIPTELQETGNIIITANGHIWASKQTRDEYKSIIKVDNIQAVVSLSDFISTSIYELLYNEWKKQYSNVTDSI